METTTYKVEGMSCEGCVKALTGALERALPGARVNVRLDGGVVQVAGEHDPVEVEAAVEDAGFDFVGAVA